MKMELVFGRINEDGNVEIFENTGERATRLDAHVYPVNSAKSARFEHPNGITLTKEDADRIGIEIED